MAFRQLKGGGGGTYVKWDTPKTVKGRLVSLIRGTYKGQPTTTIVLRQEDGVEVKVNGSAVIEGTGLYNEPAGVMVELVFKGKAKGKSGLQYNDIDVFVDSPEPDPSARPTAAPTAGATPTTAAPGTTAPASDYDTLIATLQLANPKGAAAMIQALTNLYPDPAVRIEKLRAALKEQGVL